MKELRQNPRNPRKITDKKLASLKKSLKAFGDLSGIVYNRRTTQLVGGHQRLLALQEFGIADIIFAEGSKDHGFVELNNGERYAYREVDWDESKEKAANIAANKGAGEWDVPKLTEFMLELDLDGFDLDLTMFDEDERKPFLPVEFKPATEDEQGKLDEKKKVICPECHHEFTP